MDRIAKGTCVYCGTPIVNTRRKVYCSSKCHDDYWYSHDWSWLRSKVLERDAYTCKQCGFQLKRDESGYFQVIIDKQSFSVDDEQRGEKGYLYLPFVVDHIKPVALYPELEFDASNLQVLCKWCNKIKTKTDVGYIAEVRRSEKEIEELSKFVKEHRSILEYLPIVGNKEITK